LDIRRFKVKNSITYQELIETLEQMFQLETTKDILIQYRDNESDLITITNDLELNESFLAKKDVILKLELIAGTPREVDVENAKSSLVGNKSGDEIAGYTEFCNSSQDIRVAITDAFNRFVETVSPIIEKFEKNSEMMKAALPNPKAILEQLKPIFESFLNDPSAYVMNPFRSFVNNLDGMLAEIDLWMHQKSSQGAQTEKPTPESGDQSSAESFLRHFKDLYEKVMNEANSFLQGLDDWLAEIGKWMREETEPDPKPEGSDQPFTYSIMRPFKDLYENVINEVENDTTKAEEPQLFEPQMQELRKMGFLDDDQNLAILIQKKGDLLSAVIVLIDSESTS